MFRISFDIISVPKKKDIIFLNCVLDQFNVDVNEPMSQSVSG